jgi:hypothetical protein
MKNERERLRGVGITFFLPTEGHNKEEEQLRVGTILKGSRKHHRKEKHEKQRVF